MEVFGTEHEKFQKQWNEMLNSDEGNKLKKLLAIDGKTQRGNGSNNQKANHIVSAVDEYIKIDRGRKQVFQSEKEAVCNGCGCEIHSWVCRAKKLINLDASTGSKV